MSPPCEQEERHYIPGSCRTCAVAQAAELAPSRVMARIPRAMSDLETPSAASQHLQVQYSIFTRDHRFQVPRKSARSYRLTQP